MTAQTGPAKLQIRNSRVSNQQLQVQIKQNINTLYITHGMANIYKLNRLTLLYDLQSAVSVAVCV